MANKQQIEVQFLKSDEVLTLMAKGEHSKESVIAAAKEQWEIEQDDEIFAKGKHEILWMKAVPSRERGAGYYESKAGVRGAFLASIVYVSW